MSISFEAAGSEHAAADLTVVGAGSTAITFEAAGSTGSIGPNLDDAAPSFDRVVTQVTHGGGAMPAFEDELTEQEIRDVAAFVSGS